MARLLVVLFSSVAAAFLIAGFFIWTHGPGGAYIARSVLMEPDILSQLNYNDYNPKTNAMDRFVFDRIEFTGAEANAIATPLSLVQYGQYFHLVAGDKSVSSEAEGQFRTGNAVKIKIYVRTESSAEWQKVSKLLQEIQLLPQGSNYRVSLREDEKGDHWAYFNHPGSYQELLKIVAP